MKNMQPTERPKSREEAVAHFKKALQSVDDASKAFEDKYPKDARRWKVRLFEGMTADAREQVGAPVKGDLKSTLDAVLNAPDADAESKSEASAVKVLSATEDIATQKLTNDEWLKMAEAHLKAYPTQQYNSAIEKKITGIKTLAELQTKPLELKFKAVDGREVDLAQLRGKVVLIDFWATWCGPCVAELPNVLKAYEKLHAKGFEIIGISLDQDKAALEAFVKEKGMAWPQYFDGKGWENEISTRYGIASIPAMWLVNKKGIVTSTEARGSLEASVEKLLAE
jgi:thiol-disulfide isomerase/thioredoxin